MKRPTIPFAIAIILAAATVEAQAVDQLIRRNTGLILDVPFLHQAELPYESRYLGAYGEELVTYGYNPDGLLTSIRFTELDTGTRYMDVEVTYRSDGQPRAISYLSYDETGELLYTDRFDFTRHGPTGPELGVMVSDESITAEMRLEYDEDGRLVALEEDDAYGEGVFRLERYAWTGEGATSLPYAMEVRFPLDREIERFRYLYDANGLLRAKDGVNLLESDPDDRAFVEEWYHYRSSTLDDIFGRIRPSATEPQSTAALLTRPPRAPAVEDQL